MISRELNQATLLKIQHLIEVNFTGRDELYAAADSLGDEDRQSVCSRLAERLADHAIELQQIVEANGYDPVEPAEFPDVAAALFNLAKSNNGASGVIDAAEKCEKTVKKAYDDAITNAKDQQAAGLLKRHRGEVEFGEQVLRSMQPPERIPSESG